MAKLSRNSFTFIITFTLADGDNNGLLLFHEILSTQNIYKPIVYMITMYYKVGSTLIRLRDETYKACAIQSTKL